MRLRGTRWQRARRAAGLLRSRSGYRRTIILIANAQMDSVPLVVITGQVRIRFGTDAFQEMILWGITYPIAAISYLS